MFLWRISRFADLDGRGGEVASGRWHRKGHRIVYCADHPSTALLEMLVHLDPDNIPSNYQLLKIDCPDHLVKGAARQESQMTIRQSDILARIASGRSPAELAEELGISEQTVEWYVSFAEQALDDDISENLDDFMQRTLSLRMDDPDFTMDFGTKWLTGGQACVLKVPSAVMPAASNYLVNPRHPDAGHLAITEIYQFPFDRRLG